MHEAGIFIPRLLRNEIMEAQECCHKGEACCRAATGCELFSYLRGCPCKNRPLDFRPKTEFLQIFRVRQLVHVINKNGNNLAVNAVFQYFWRPFQRTVQNRLNRSVSSQI